MHSTLMKCSPYHQIAVDSLKIGILYLASTSKSTTKHVHWGCYHRNSQRETWSTWFRCYRGSSHYGNDDSGTSVSATLIISSASCLRVISHSFQYRPQLLMQWFISCRGKRSCIGSSYIVVSHFTSVVTSIFAHYFLSVLAVPNFQFQKLKEELNLSVVDIRVHM